MNELIKDFINIYGDNTYKNIEEYLIKNNLVTDFYNTNYDLYKLFDFSLEYGIIELVQFLYENKGITYNFNIISKYYKKIEDNTSTDINSIPIINQQCGKDGLNIKFEDKFSINRDQCLNYLLNIRKKSIMNIKNGNFYYKYNISKYNKEIT